MKNLFTYAGAILAAAALVFSCKTPESEMTPSVLQLDPPTATLSPFTQSLSFTLQCDLHWSASLEDDSWGQILTQSSREGVGASLLFKCSVNTAREARSNVLVIKAGKSELRREITQEGLGSFFEPQAPEITGAESVTVRFNAPFPWTASVTEGEQWLSISATSGTKGESSLVCSAGTVNYDEAPRTGTVSVRTGSVELSFAVTQAPSEKDPVLLVTRPGLYGIRGNDYVFGAEGWNQASFLTEADGSLRWRLLHAGNLSAVTLTGMRAEESAGETLTLRVKVVGKGSPSLMENYAATLLYEKDGDRWYKVNDETYFVIKKEVTL